MNGRRVKAAASASAGLAVRPADRPPDEFAQAVLDLVEQVPSGMATTYGDLAEMLDSHAPRRVGTVLTLWGHDLPWHRVVRADGRPHRPDVALPRFVDEGTPLRRGGERVDLAACRWSGPAQEGPRAQA